MEPEQNISTLEAVSDATPETAKVAEYVPTTPDPQPQSQPADDQVIAKDPPIQAEPIAELPTEEVKDLADSSIESADRDWVGKVRQVMKDDSGQPYKEEEDAEALSEDYMKQRFNVDVDAPVEEK